MSEPASRAARQLAVPQHPRGRVTDDQVLVLNQNHEPLNVTTVRRAVALVLLSKAEIIEANGAFVRSESVTLRAPSVIRMCYHIRRPIPLLKLTRKSIFARDDHTCQYCGKATSPLTLDHVIPKARGGQTTWDNVVTCCIRCNNLKGDRTPREANLRLVRPPKRPRYTPYVSLPTFLAARRARRWAEHLDPWVQCDL